MRSTTLPLLLVMAICVIGGCNRTYHLPGHNDSNLDHPPDITMRAKEISLSLQDHSNPVRYRNIWVRPIKGYDAQ